MTNFSRGRVPCDDVLFAREGHLGRVLLNRPRAINALTADMCTSMHAELAAWSEDDGIRVVSIEGAGERGLCAGGDVRAVREAGLAGSRDGIEFWKQEYQLDALIAEYAKPVIAVMDGIVMGGGLGLSMFGSLRLLTKSSKLAMPETIIGFFPDVAATYLLSRAPGETGTHLALTGSTIGAADGIYVGLGDVLVEAQEVEAVLRRAADEGAAEVRDRLDAGPAPLAAQRDWIDECYVGDDAAAIVARLREHPTAEARSAAEAIEQRSPFAVAVSLEALRRARSAGSVREVLAADAVISEGMLGHPDFAEGVRAQLVDKDKSPRWADASVADVDRAQVLAVFEPAAG